MSESLNEITEIKLEPTIKHEEKENEIIKSETVKFEENSNNKKKERTRVLLTFQEKIAVAKCYKAIAELMPKNTSKRQIESKIAEIFSISRAQVFKIMADHVKGEIPKTSRTGTKPKSKFFYDETFKQKLTNYVQTHNDIKLQYTVKDIVDYAAKELGYTGGRSTMYKILKSLNYTYQKDRGQFLLKAKPKSGKNEKKNAPSLGLEHPEAVK